MTSGQRSKQTTSRQSTQLYTSKQRMANQPEPEPSVPAQVTGKHRVTPEPETNPNVREYSKWFSVHESANYTTQMPSVNRFTNEYATTSTNKYPIPESSPEPETEPEPTSTPSPEPEPSSAPNPEPEPEPERNSNWGEVSPEPGPDFYQARNVWGVAWPIHYFVCAVIFALLFFVTLNSIAALLCGTKNTRFQRRRFFLAVNIMLCYLCFVMALSMFIDPYGSGEFIKIIKFRGIIYLLITMKYPCLTTSFSLVQISILEAVKFKLYSTRLHSLRLIFITTFVHFSVVVVGGLVMLSVRSTLAISITCQAFLLCVGLVFSAMSIYSGLRICFYYSDSEVTLNKIKNDSVDSVITTQSEVAVTIGSSMVSNGESAMQGTSIQLSSISEDTGIDYEVHSSTPGPIRKSSNFSKSNFGKRKTKKEKKISRISVIINIDKKDNSIHRIAILLVTTAVFALLLCACVVFHLLASTLDKFDWWNWYIYQTISRLSECGMVACLALIVQRKNPCSILSGIRRIKFRRQSDLSSTT